jgi:spore maturation protein SpmB
MELFKLILDWAAIVVIPLILLIFIGMAEFKKVKVYEMFVEGAKEGFQIGVKIIPYLVAMLVAIAMFRASGTSDHRIYRHAIRSSSNGLNETFIGQRITGCND